MRTRIVGILFLALAMPFFSFTQLKYERLKQLYTFVDKADSLSRKSHKTFYLEKFLEDNYTYKEKWRYAEKDGRVVYFEIDFILDSVEYTEVYYVNRGSLVCSEEYEKINYSFTEDKLRSGGVYYFEGFSAQHVVRMGNPGGGFNTSYPELAVLHRFEKRFSELKQHIPMLP
jgi:hypothetical protein